MQDPYDPQHPEDDRAGKEEHRNDGEQVHDAVIGPQKSQPGLPPGKIRIQIISSPYSQDIFHAEKQRGYDLNASEELGIAVQFLKSIQDDHKYIKENVGNDNIVKNSARYIALVSDLYDVKNFLLHGNNYRLVGNNLQVCNMRRNDQSSGGFCVAVMK